MVKTGLAGTDGDQRERVAVLGGGGSMRSHCRDRLLEAGRGVTGVGDFHHGFETAFLTLDRTLDVRIG